MSLMHQIAAAVTLIAQLRQNKTCVVRLFAEDLPNTNHTKAILGGFNEAHPNITVKIKSDAFDMIRDQQISPFQRSDGAQNVMQIIP